MNPPKVTEVWQVLYTVFTKAMNLWIHIQPMKTDILKQRNMSAEIIGLSVKFLRLRDIY